MFGKVSKYFPVQGANKFETISFPITKGIAVDFGAVTSSGVVTIVSVPKGSCVLSVWGRITEAYETAGTGAGFTLGFTGTALLSSAHASGTATLDTIICPPDSSGMSLILTAADTVDLTIGTSGAATAGKMDVYVSYIPIPSEGLSTADFLSVIAT